MQERHKNREKYFEEQITTVTKYVLPYLQTEMDINSETTILEIGCGEGGNLKPFLDLGCKRVVGVDLSEYKIKKGREYFQNDPRGDVIELLVEDIYNVQSLGTFDLILTRDVIEHIHDQERFLGFVKKFLKSDGKIFFGFPPWYNPMGGHQQICKSRFLSKLPYLHLLPGFLYKGVLKLFGESDATIEALREIKETGISIERLERILKRTNYRIDKKTLYFINPNYETKFGLKPRKQAKIIAIIPFVRNFFTTAGYYVASVKPPKGQD